MKRYTRWVAAVTVLLLCLSLCSCARLDELKARHAVWQEDGTILWNDAVYKPLPDMGEEVGINRYRLDDQPLRVTEADVPVLLSTSSRYFNYFEKDSNGVFLRGYVERDDDYHGKYILFCREDRYEEIAAEFANGFEAKGLCYDYYDNQLSAMQTYYVNVAQEYDLSYVLSTAEWFFYDDDFHTVYEAELYWHDAFDLYREYEMLLMYTGGGFYLVKDNIAYTVPTVYEQTMRDILQPGYSSYKTEQKEWYE